MELLIKNILKVCAIHTDPIDHKFKSTSLRHLGQRYKIYTGIIDHVPVKSELVMLGKVLDNLFALEVDHVFYKVNNKVNSIQGKVCTIQSLHVEYTTDYSEESQSGGYINVVVTVSYNKLNKLGNVTVTISSDLD